MANYWIVGATWGGVDDQYEKFVTRGHWYLGYEDHEQPGMADLRDRIVSGDRIAIKRMLGKGATEIEIRALGIVKDYDPSTKYVYVDWVLTNLKRKVPSRGNYSSIRGPFDPNDEWTRMVFML